MIIVLLRKDKTSETIIKLHTQRHYFTRTVLNYQTQATRHSDSRISDTERFIAVRMKRGYRIIAKIPEES